MVYLKDVSPAEKQLEGGSPLDYEDLLESDKTWKTSESISQQARRGFQRGKIEE